MKTMVDNAKIARMEKNIKETDAKVKNIKSVPPSTTADAGKVLTVNEDGSISWQQKGAGGGMKAFFDAGGKCGNSAATSFDGVISFEDTSDVTDMSYMFNACTNLTEPPLFDTRKVTDMKIMFNSCGELTTIPAYDVSNVTNFGSMFDYCIKLSRIHMINIGANLDIHYSKRFTREALLEIIGNLKTVTSTKKLTIGSNNLAKLTEEDKAIATNKGWTLA